ncbi:MAG: DUF5123 domain-containing protein [Saprospiraceae bacterium]|nr:DUF4957 domain-containing protein [Lewinella sp.]
MKLLKYKYPLLFALLGLLILAACTKDDEQMFERTRLFRPVLNEPLMAEGNTIIVNMGNIREANSYTLEISRDSFVSIDYTIETDTSYLVLDATTLNGNQLFWNTIYQVRAWAHADDPNFDSEVADLGSVRTQRFPSILNLPASYDVIDVAAKVTWTRAGAPVTQVKRFADDDLQLSNSLESYDVSTEEEAAGVKIITGLDPSTTYQFAIYSGATLRGWANYTTLEAGVDPMAAGVIDLSESQDSFAVINAVPTAPDGAIILLKRGMTYFLPSDPLGKSITIRGAYGFEDRQAELFTTGNWNLIEGSNIDHIRFIDLILRGEDPGGDYVFNPSLSGVTTVREMTFDNCFINSFRGILRVRGGVMVEDYTIQNSIVHNIGGYGIFTADTDGEGGASIANITLKNSTFSKVNTFIQSRQNSNSIVIEDCTLNEFTTRGGRVFRYRGGDGFNNVLNGITISNTIWGHGWDEGDAGSYEVRFVAEGLSGTTFNLSNNFGTANFQFSEGYELAGFPGIIYSGTAADLWVDPYDGLDFHFKDSGFSGRLTAGDPRWRPDL